jgi:acetoin utilization deacetylase AcuC-like enzyme
MGAPRSINFREQLERKRQAEIDLVVAEFGGDKDTPAALARMALALLAYRRWLRQLVDAGEMIAQGKPFTVMGPGPYWKPDEFKPWPWR